MNKSQSLEIVSKDGINQQQENLDYPLLDSAGRHIGQIDVVTINDGRIIVEGWALSRLVGLTSADHKLERAPHMHRSDVLEHLGETGFDTPGFRLEMPMTPNHIVFWLDLGGVRYAYPMPKRII
ncbi:hypothetical protein [Paracoccus sp. S4493]|uniref:hypothetical protein n=1 Tax=Paracoccus sp. S4493 TaxID=579490 RepID=UPI000AC9121F|nr:hypothetical protein [Paracoccus sp. S4493]